MVCDLAPDPPWTEWDWRKSLPSICSREGDHNLLDSVATVMLLGSALTGPGLVRRYLSPQQESRHFAASVHKLLLASDHCTSGAFWRQRSDGLSYIHLFREKNRAKHVAKYQLFQTAMPHILMGAIKDFLKILSTSGPDSALPTGALNHLLKL
jgi:hypothetical protein